MSESKESSEKIEDPYTTIVVDVETQCFKRPGQTMRLLQLAWQLFSSQSKLLSECQFKVKPDKWVVTEEAAKLHGITTEIATKEGYPLKSVLKAFCDDLKKARVWVGHSVDSVDFPVLTYELTECDMLWAAVQMKKQMHIFDTMKSSVNIVELPRALFGGFKWPKLKELYEFLFEEKFNQTHDALEDVRATSKCYWRLQDLAKSETTTTSVDTSSESIPQTPSGEQKA